ncbi:MAG: lamin tail domain-containing protein [Kiritimatiellae bacterium]|nr:lamin tail domain-containing protein [Kiritimatiellia bacterium]
MMNRMVTAWPGRVVRVGGALLCLWGLPAHVAADQPPGSPVPFSPDAPLVARASGGWRFRKGTAEASDPRDEWRNPDFDDSSWSTGTAPFGYGVSGLNTTFSDMQGSYSSMFLRQAFTVEAIPADMRLRVGVDYDDGFIIWINGQRVLDANEPDGTPVYNSLADGENAPGVYEPEELADGAEALEPGPNVLAVQVFNNSLAGSDCKFDLELTWFRRVADTKFSRDRGFYEAPFDVTISTATAGATIRYTTDGTAPSASYGTAGGTNIVLHIATTRCLRAAAFKDGYEPTDVDTHTYLFAEHVLAQPQTVPPGYPSTWGNHSWGALGYGDYGGHTPIPADHGMDPDIVNDPAYSGMIAGALKAVPTLSIVMDKADMFVGSNSVFGIEALADAVDYKPELPTSVELIYPGAPQDSFQVDCGIQRHARVTDKRSLRLEFKGEFGVSKLKKPFFKDAPLGADSATERFDRIVLRAGMNKCWASPWNSESVAYTRDEWVRASQTAMTGQGVHGTFMHLYINGMYWGLYNPVERPDAWFASDYFGGEHDDWFAVNHGGAISGDPARWNYLVSTLRSRDMTVAANYAEMKQYLDVTPYSDYLVLLWFMGTRDWPGNNWYAGMRNSPPGPARFFVWDAEGSFNMLDQTAWVSPDFRVGASGSSALVRLWHSVRRNGEFMTLFADRVYAHCFNDGALVEAALTQRWDTATAYIRDAVVCESARWGDCYPDPVLKQPDGSLAPNPATPPPPYARDAHWTGAVDDVRGFVSGNVARFLAALRAQGYYPTVDPPVFSTHGGVIGSGFKLTMSNPNGSGAVTYTTDGRDPRASGGVVAGTAYSGPLTLSRTTHVKARVCKTATTWSAVHAATYNYTAHYSRIRITEILYNPLGGGDYEFIELKNTGSSTRGLSEMTFKGVRYTFAPGAELEAGAVALLVANEALFTNRYPNARSQAALFGQYEGRLDNGGERLALLDCEGRTVTAVPYNDKAPWPEPADGAGYSLTVVDPDADPDDPANWRASNLIGGSPGYDDGAPYRVVISEALAHTDLPQTDTIELHNAGTAPADIGGWYLSDSAVDYRKYPITAGTVLAAGGYIVFDETDFNTDTNDPNCFALSSHGDQVYLTKWDGAGNLQVLAEARFGGSANGAAFGRHTTSDGSVDFVEQSVPDTLGSANAYPRVGPVVINEIMYHPVDGSLEYVELRNVSDGPVALYDTAAPTHTWRLDAAVEYAFPAGTTLDAREYVLVAPTNEAAFRAVYPDVPAGVRIFGPYAGRLNNGGESVKLWRPDAPDPEGVPWILVDRVQYDDNSPWPESADGDGPSLERLAEDGYGNDPANWSASAAAGGTPGEPNGGMLVCPRAGWRYQDRGEDLGTGWRAADYDTSYWADGNAPLGYADADAYPELDTLISYGDDPNAKPVTVYFRRTFELGIAPAAVTNLALGVKYDDGFVAYLNGYEVARASLPAGTISYGTLAVSHTAADYEPFDLSSHTDKLVQGRNVLAVDVHQSDPASSDLFFAAQLRAMASIGNPPAAPANLAAAALSQTRISLSWSDTSDNEDGFKIDRRMSGTGVWDRIGQPGANTTAYADSGLAVGTTYYYRVKAYNADGNSPYSAVAAAATLDGPPAAPTNLAVTATAPTAARLTWEDRSGNETGFTIDRRISGGVWEAAVATVAADVTVHTDTGLTPGTLYDYRVRAGNAYGDSDYSNVDSGLTPNIQVAFEASSASGSEAQASVWVAVRLSAPSTQPIRVDYASTGGTASAGTDYTLTPATLTFAPGETAKSISLTVRDDTDEEGNETVVLGLSNPQNAVLGAPSTHTYTITDNDQRFVAYNDLCWVAGEPAQNITSYTRDQSGLLLDYSSGQATPVSLSVSGGSAPITFQGIGPQPGTDAYDIFMADGQVGLTGLLSYNPANLVLSFTGLDTGLRYEFAVFGNRGETNYTDRMTAVRLAGVEPGFRNTSSAGTTVTTTTVSNDTTAVCNGYNTVNGHVARFTGIDPGADGAFTVTLSDNDSKFYANALMLRALEAATSVPVVAKGVAWAYSDSGADLGTGWRTAPYDDSGWAQGPAGLGYPDSRAGVTTVVSYGADPNDKHITTYFRTRFNLGCAPADVQGLVLNALYDDGFVAYLNGQELARGGMPAGTVSASTTATVQDGSRNLYEAYDVSALTGLLLIGENVLAVEIHQISPTSSDIVMDVELVADVPVGQVNVTKVEKGGGWRYRKGTAEASEPATAWRRAAFDDSGWSTGAAPFGYGSLAYGTTLGDMLNSYASVFLRRPFAVANPALVSTLALNVDYDDGFIAWLNGEEIARVNVQGAPGTFLAHDTTCTGYVTAASASYARSLVGGEIPALGYSNVLAVQLFNYGLTSGDALLDAALTVLEGSFLGAGADGDGDGMSDDWETANLGGTGSSGTGDLDGDGALDVEEYIAGTAPSNAASFFGLDLSFSGGALLVSFLAREASGAGYSGLERRYRLEQCAVADADAAWVSVPGYTRIPGQNQTVVYTNTSLAGTVHYRGRVWLEAE